MPYNGGVSLREAPARWAGEISATTVAPSAAVTRREVVSGLTREVVIRREGIS